MQSVITCAKRREILGNDPLANYQADHPSNPHSQPIQQPYVKRTSKFMVILLGNHQIKGIWSFRSDVAARLPLTHAVQRSIPSGHLTLLLEMEHLVRWSTC